jgi:hypothetical protein
MGASFKVQGARGVKESEVGQERSEELVISAT